MSEDLQKVTLENALLRETLANEQDESMWRFWNNEARSIAADRKALRETLAAKEAENAKLREALEYAAPADFSDSWLSYPQWEKARKALAGDADA